MVVALLKIVAYVEDRQRRRKDLDDLCILFHMYEASSDRIFSDAVFAAELEDVADASAFLLGADTGAFATGDEAAIVRNFLELLQIPAEELAKLDPDDFRQGSTQRLQQQLRAFSQGFFNSPSPSRGSAFQPRP